MRDHDKDGLSDDRLDSRLDETRRGLAHGEEERLQLNEEQLAIQKRQAAAGQVEVEKHVETRHVTESVPVTRDEVTVERRPLNGQEALHADGAFQEEHISVPLTREEVTAEKRVVGAEELVLRKREVQEEQRVEADLRREHADVHRTGDVRRVDEMRADGVTDADPLRGGRDLDGDGVR